jgi:hypothetical protein
VRRRWFQFSLRGFLIAVTVFAGWLGWKIDRVRRHREAIRAVDAFGAGYGVRIDRSKTFLAMAKRLGYDEQTFYDVDRLSLGHDPKTPVDDETLESLAGHIALFTDMYDLTLRGPAITNRGVAALPHLPKVKSLFLEGTCVSDGLGETLQRFPRLKMLDLTKTGVTAAGVEDIQRRFPDCMIFR